MAYSSWTTNARGWEKTFDDGGTQLTISLEKEFLLGLLSEDKARYVVKMRKNKFQEDSENAPKWVAIEKNQGGEKKWVDLKDPEDL
jgi:hypothetical protein